MAETLTKTDAVVPTPQDTELAVEASRALAARPRERLRIRLGNDQELILPHAAELLIAHLLTEMAQGNAVTLIPVHAELTTQEAADFLNVSRPYLIRLLEEGKMQFRMVGTHRRVKFSDLTAYKKDFEAAQKAAFEELAAQSQEMKLGY